MLTNKKEDFPCPGDNYVWNPIAFTGTPSITDPITGKVFTNAEARQQPKEVRSRLVIRYPEQGTWVKKA